jgi:CBS domain-containing protein
MICPVCRHDNFEGEDSCENCGADLRTVDIPQPATDYRGRLLGQHLDELRPTTPRVLEADADAELAIQLMHETGIDCVLVTEGGIAVAIHKMAVGGFRHIPIVDGGGLPTGIVTAKDVFRHIAETMS